MTTHSDPSPGTEALSRESLAHRKGYNERFLGAAVPLPRPADSGIETLVLPYTNFSAVFRPDRRLAAATAVTIDGGRLVDVPREDEWRFDPRLPEAQQAGHLVYQHNPLDKGHLVRRLDPVWQPRCIRGERNVCSRTPHSAMLGMTTGPSAGPGCTRRLRIDEGTGGVGSRR